MRQELVALSHPVGGRCRELATPCAQEAEQAVTQVSSENLHSSGSSPCLRLRGGAAPLRSSSSTARPRRPRDPSAGNGLALSRRPRRGLKHESGPPTHSSHCGRLHALNEAPLPVQRVVRMQSKAPPLKGAARLPFQRDDHP